MSIDIQLQRYGRTPLRDQIVLQIKRMILQGDWTAGLRLPSVRAFARRLEVHPKTVLAAYRKLEREGHVTIRAGVGARLGPPADGTEQRPGDLEQLLETAFDHAFQLGYTGDDIRNALRGWLRTAPADQVLATDPCLATAEILAYEVRAAVPVPVAACALSDVEQRAKTADRLLVVCLPLYTESLRRRLPGIAVRTLRLPPLPSAVHEMPADGLAVVVSHSPSLLPYAAGYLEGFYGAAIELECREASRGEEWLPLAAIADIVFADAVCAPAVREARVARRVAEFRLASEDSLQELRGVLELVHAAAAPAADCEPEYATARGRGLIDPLTLARMTIGSPPLR